MPNTQNDIMPIPVNPDGPHHYPKPYDPKEDPNVNASVSRGQVSAICLSTKLDGFNNHDNNPVDKNSTVISAFSKLQSQLNSLSSDVSSNGDTISAVGVKGNNNASDIRSIKETIDNIEQTIGQIKSSISGQIESATVFSEVPTTFKATVITVTSPHKRQFMWNGEAYKRAPWDQPGILKYTIADVSQMDGYLELTNGVDEAAEEYPDLADVLGIDNTPGSGSRLIIKKHAGLFIRTLNDTFYGTDRDRRSGSIQTDAMRKIEAIFPLVVPDYYEQFLQGCVTATDSVTDLQVNYPVTWEQGGFKDPHKYGIKFDSSIKLPTADENRPINIAYRLWVSI